MEVKDLNGLIFSKGKVNDEVWDDSALLKAYEKAYTSLQNEVEGGNSETPLTTQSASKNKKKSKKKMIDWKVGDKCMSVYEEDGLLYEGKIISISGEKCVVLYDYYENEEEKLLRELKKLSASQSSIPELIKEERKLNSNDIPSPSSFSQSPGVEPHNLIPPPPLPSLSMPPDERDCLHSMLTSWYMSGYYAGYYKGRLEAKNKITPT